MLPVWPMRPLLQSPSGEAITRSDQWQARTESIRQTFLDTIGPRPDSQRLRGIEIDSSQIDGDVKRTIVRLDVGDDTPMEAWLMEPASPADHAAPRRVALALHQTTQHGKDEVAGLAGEDSLAYGKELAQRGWTVLAPDQFSLERRLGRGLGNYKTARLYEQFPDWSGVGKTIADAQMALDAMEQMPQTKGAPVAVLGHSLGGHSSLFLAAIDPRPAAIVCNCGLYPFSDSCARAHFFRTQGYIYFKHADLRRSVIDGPQPLWDFHEVAALAAPRPLMILMALNDDLSRAIPGMVRTSEELHGLYEFLAATGRLSCVLHNEAHSFRPWHRQAVYSWLESVMPSTH